MAATTGSGSGRPDVLEVGGKAIALAAALLPATGVVVRWIAFSAANIHGGSLQLGWSAPLSQLVATAIVSLLPSLLVLPLMVPITRPLVHVEHGLHRARALTRKLDDLRAQMETLAPEEAVPPDLVATVATFERESDELKAWFEEPQPSNWLDRLGALITRRLGNVGARILWYVFIGIGILFVPSFPAAAFAFLSSFVAVTLVRRAARTNPRLGLPQLWPAVVALLLIGATAGGLNGGWGGLAGVSPGFYVFDSRVGGLRDGRFQPLAQAGGRMYLEPCRPRRRDLVGVREDAIATARPDPSSSNLGPNLWSILFKHERLILGSPRC
jgi:hypothetical protein